MSFRLEDLLLLQRPSRYIGGETNAVFKSEDRVDLHVALAFPDVYEIGMSHLGLKILYGLINRRPEFWAERVMAPWGDLEEELRRTGKPLTSLESGRPLADFDVVGFSLQYELSYTNILNMLDLAGLPLESRKRGPEAPLIIGGGPGAFNPEPLADIFDLFFLGEAEAGLPALLDDIVQWRKARGSREELYAHLAGRPGIYIPSLFEPVYEKDRLIEIRPLRPGYESVSRAVCPDLEAAYYPERAVVPFTKPIHDRVALEISRGCTRGCRFCQAGFLYRPVRERRPETILKWAEESLKATGLADVSFLSLSAGDYTCLQPLMADFMDRYGPEHVALSLPSLRVRSLNREMMTQIKRVRKTGFTLAPEAGTQRLRDVINKDLTEADLLQAAGEAFQAGWRLIKLYFMLGLPTETREDVEAIADLAHRVRSGVKGKVNVSFAVFVPKPHTPFQWAPMLAAEECRERMELLRARLKRPGLTPKWNHYDLSLVEGILSRGDRRLGPVIRRVFERGARFDAWSEMMRTDRWRKALAAEGLTEVNYLRARSRDECLPWSHLLPGAKVDYLWSEYEKARRAGTTPDCRHGDCLACGVCDFKEIAPRLCRESVPVRPPAVEVSRPEEPVVCLRLNYGKESLAALLSHLETMDVFFRAFRRAGLRTAMSRGFHPQPRVRFATPLPVGLVSRDEYLEASFLSPPEPEIVRESLNGQLPAGLRIRTVRAMSAGTPKILALGSRYRIESEEALFDADTLRDVLTRDHVWVAHIGKKGARNLDLLSQLVDPLVLTPHAFELTLTAGPNGSIRPKAAAEALFALKPDRLAGMKIVKVGTLLKERPCPDG